MDPSLNSIPKFQNTNTKCQVYGQNSTENAEVLKSDEPKEKIELFFTLSDFNSKQDKAYALKVDIVTKSKSLMDLGSTFEQQGGSPKIHFDKSFIIDYYFEIKQILLISILEQGNKIAEVEATVGKIMGAKKQVLSTPFNSGEYQGKLKIKGEPIKMDETTFELNMAVEFGMKNIKPFFIIKRNVSTWTEINWIKAYKSEVLVNYPNGNRFNKISLGSQFLCNNDLEKKPILIEFYDFNDSTQKPIGGFCAPLNKLITCQKEILMDPEGKKLDGMFILFQCKFTKNYRFLDYIKGGTQISFMAGIDFTKSNGNLKDPESLHSIQKRPNLYEMAIDTCCSIIAQYDNDQLFPVFGYGAIVDKKANVVSHCFPLNMKDDPNIHTVQGILTAYRNIIENQVVVLYGPTYFAPIIKICSQIAKNTKNNLTYSILMILTDGMINDWQETTDIIVEASGYPLSIIIVGIGPDEDEQFPDMHELDCDGSRVLENSSGEKAKRDIVQFVEFNKFKNDPKLLAEKVFEEIPKHVEEFYKMINLPPVGQ